MVGSLRGLVLSKGKSLCSRHCQVNINRLIGSVFIELLVMIRLLAKAILHTVFAFLKAFNPSELDSVLHIHF